MPVEHISRIYRKPVVLSRVNKNPEKARELEPEFWQRMMPHLKQARAPLSALDKEFV